MSVVFGLITLALLACWTWSMLSGDYNTFMFGAFGLTLSFTFFLIAYKAEKDSYESMKMLKKAWTKEEWAKRLEKKGQ